MAETDIAYLLIEWIAEDFDPLRKILRIAEPRGLNGLNDDALNCEMGVMEAEIKKFINSQ